MVRGGQTKNLQGAGRLLQDKDFDGLLAGWVRERRALNQKVSRKMIVDRAKKMYKPTFAADSEESSFSASHGWLEKFLVRHNFRSRVPTSICQKPPKEYAQKIVDFMMYLARIRTEKK